jgi:hypothetical protein
MLSFRRNRPSALALALLVSTHAVIASAQVSPSTAPKDTAATTQSAPPVSSPLRADVEIDPTAYVFNGHSLHVGLGDDRWRVDLGNFAIDVPSFAEKNDGFRAWGSGFGMKFQRFLLSEPRAWLVGIDAAVARINVREQATDRLQGQTQLAVGVNAGYRFMLPRDFYITTWLGLSYALGAKDLQFGTEEYQMSRWLVFPAIHLGYRIR